MLYLCLKTHIYSYFLLSAKYPMQCHQTAQSHCLQNSQKDSKVPIKEEYPSIACRKPTALKVTD